MTGKVGARDPALVNDAPAGHRPSGFDPARGSGDFSIGSDFWPGISKLIEECGEVVQVCGKLLGSGGDTSHWDGTNLRDRLSSELGDLTAAITFVTDQCGLSSEEIWQRTRAKLDLFYGWHRTPATRAIAMEARQGGDACGSVHDSAAIAQGGGQ